MIMGLEDVGRGLQNGSAGIPQNKSGLPSMSENRKLFVNDVTSMKGKRSRT